ncbi:MAG: class I SAM-dependent methyltransferase [Candidatus Omnitrophota bacterium]
MKILLKKCYDQITRFAFKNMEIKSKTRILDIGCGKTGNFWGFAPENYIGLDADRNVLRKLAERRDGTYKLQDVCQGLPYPDGFFDYVLSVSFFHHLSAKQAKQLIVRIKRILSKNGRAIIADGVYPDSRLNVLGWLIRYFDRGHYVRHSDEFAKLFLEDFYIENSFSFSQSIFAYTALLLRPKND